MGGIAVLANEILGGSGSRSATNKAIDANTYNTQMLIDANTDANNALIASNQQIAADYNAAYLKATQMGADATTAAAAANAAAITTAAELGYAAADLASGRVLQQWNEQKEMQMPWVTAGQKALGQLEGLAGQDLTYPGGKFSYPKFETPKDFSFTAQDFLNNIDPSYGWRQHQGIQALLASGAAAGNYGSGNMATALLDFGQGLASTEYGNAYNRAAGTYGINLNKNVTGYGLNYTNAQNEYAMAYNQWVNARDTTYNRLAGLAGTGMVASQQLAQQGMGAVGMINSYNTSAAANAGNLGVQGSQYQGNLLVNQANNAGNNLMNTTNYLSNLNNAGAIATGNMGINNAQLIAANTMANVQSSNNRGSYLSNTFNSGLNNYMNYMMNQGRAVNAMNANPYVSSGGGYYGGGGGGGYGDTSWGNDFTGAGSANFA